MIKKAPIQRSQNSDKRMLDAPDHYAVMHQGFTWQVDEYFNIAEVCCSRWARVAELRSDAPESIAVNVHHKSTKAVFHTYSELKQAADALSYVLAALGV